MVCMLGVSDELWKVARLLRSPLRLERHLYPTTVPSGSVPWPVKVTGSPGEAVVGVIESMYAVGS